MGTGATTGRDGFRGDSTGAEGGGMGVAEGAGVEVSLDGWEAEVEGSGLGREEGRAGRGWVWGFETGMERREGRGLMEAESGGRDALGTMGVAG